MKRLLPILAISLIVVLWFVPSTRAFFARTLFDIALSPAMGKVVGFDFEYASPLLPVDKVIQTEKTIAFYHPRPSWQKHILIIPRKGITTIFDLMKQKDYLESIYQTARSVFLSEQLNVDDYALLVNGGLRQDVKQVHFHLYQKKAELTIETLSHSPLLSMEDFKVYQITEEPKLHFVFVPTQPLPPLSQWQDLEAKQLAGLMLPLAELEQRYKLNARGFSLIFQESNRFENEQLVIHLTAGTLK
ncbi:MAG: HIT domain-containing protein [Trueperaceae bacterium]